MARGDKSEPGAGLGDGPEAQRLSHEEAELLISKTWDGEITAAEAELLSLHLPHCPECAKSAEEMGRLLARVDACVKRERQDRA